MSKGSPGYFSYPGRSIEEGRGVSRVWCSRRKEVPRLPFLPPYHVD